MQCDDVLLFGYKVYNDIDTVCSIFAAKYVIDLITCISLSRKKN